MKGTIEGIILAAGEGTRMRPITRSVPKPLLPVAGVPLINTAAGKLLRCGAKRIHINLFHLGGMIRDYAVEAGWPVIFHEEKELLDTGGGIGNMAGDLRGADHILLHNGDVLSSFGFEEALGFHSERGAMVTMILMRASGGIRTPPPSVVLGEDGNVLEIGRSSGTAEREYGYTGMSVISGEALGSFPGCRMGLVDILSAMISRKPGSVAGFDASAAPGAVWGEIGSPESYLDIHRRIMLERTWFDGVAAPPLPIRAGDGASIDQSAKWAGFLDVGEGAVIEGNTYLEDCVLFPGAVVRSGSRLRSAIVQGEAAMEVG